MSALVASFFLVGYLLAPGVVYRLFFSIQIPSKRYQRTRTEEIVFSLLVTVLPFFFSWLILLHTPLGTWPAFTLAHSKSEAYRAVFQSLLPGPSLTPANPLSARIHLADAYLRGFLEQGRFLSLLWLLCAIEGWICARIVSGYGDYSPARWRDRLRKWLCDEFLLAYVSEWEILFTNLALPSSMKNVAIHIDALADDVLYRGQLINWFLDSDGKLEGIFLENASRFNREELLRDRGQNIHKPTDSYWRSIPGAKLYLVAGTISNYNIRYVPPPGSVAVPGPVPALAETTLAQLRARLGSDTVFTPIEDPEGSGDFEDTGEPWPPSGDRA